MKFGRLFFGKTHKKHYGRINVDDLDKITSFIHLKLLLGLILMCMCCPSGVVDV